MNNYKEKDIPDSFQAFLVKDAAFTSKEEYPILREEMVPDCVPVKIMPFEKAINCKGDLHDTIICTFSPDKTFERIRRNPKRYLPFFKRTAGIIGFDFSVHSDMPIIKQKSQMNDNLSLTFYYGNNGIPVYPSCRCGSEELEDEYLAAFPKGTYIAFGVHGFIKKKYQRHEWRCWFKKVIDTLQPKGVIVIGHLDTQTEILIKKWTDLYQYDSYIEEREKGVERNGH